MGDLLCSHLARQVPELANSCLKCSAVEVNPTNPSVPQDLSKATENIKEEKRIYGFTWVPLVFFGLQNLVLMNGIPSR